MIIDKANYSTKGALAPTTGHPSFSNSPTSYSFTFLSNEHIIKVEGMSGFYPINNLKDQFEHALTAVHTPQSRKSGGKGYATRIYENYGGDRRIR
jgi:hypothetical protein